MREKMRKLAYHFTIVVILIIIIVGYSYAENDSKYNISPTKDDNALYGVYIPIDLNDAFVELKKILSPELIEEMKNGSEREMIRYHRGLGMWMRNNWGLWKGSGLSSYFNKLGIDHPDDMSGIILNSFWRHLNGQPLELKKQVKYYQDYWRKCREAEKD